MKPRLRGLSHELAFYLALPLGVALVLEADTGRGRAAAAVFAASVAAMFGASGLYHRVDGPDARPRGRPRLHGGRPRLRVPAAGSRPGSLRLPRALPRPRDRGRRLPVRGGCVLRAAEALKRTGASRD